MSNTIQIKRSSTASSVPTAGQLAQGELAVNLVDKKLYTKDNTNAVVELTTPAVTIASTAEAQAGTNNTNVITPLRMREGFNASGSAPVYACRAWVNFDGTTTTPTIRASGNVSSVTRNGTGDYTVNFTTAMPDANYAIDGTSAVTLSDFAVVSLCPVTFSTSSARIRLGFTSTTNSQAPYDSASVSVAIFR
jgi:hypothetical protein